MSAVGLREDVEGKAGEMENASRRTKEEESKSGKREVGGDRERLEVNSKLVCHGCTPSLYSCGECAEVFSELEVVEVGNVGDVVSGCVFLSVVST